MPSTKKDLLLDQITACHDDLSWYPTFMNAVQGLSAKEAAWKQNESSHSILQIVNHLAFWNQRWLDYFTGKEVISSTRIDNKLTFDSLREEVSEDTWEATVKRLDSIYIEWKRTLNECSESKLDSLAPNYPVDCPWWGLVSNLCTHNAYHIGQIVFIRKQQENW